VTILPFHNYEHSLDWYTKSWNEIMGKGSPENNGD